MAGTWKKTLLVVVVLIIANGLWGGSAVVYKIGLLHMHPLVLSFYRQIFSTLVLIVLAGAIERHLPAKSELGWFTLIGFLGVYLNQLGFAFGVKYAGAVVASVMQLIVSPATTTLAILLKMEKYAWLKVLGIVICIGGSATIIGFKDVSFAEGKGLGVLILLAQAIFAAGYIVCQKNVLERVPPITTTAAMYAAGTPFMVITCFVILPFDNATYSVDTAGIWSIVYAVAAQSVLAYILSAYANKQANSSTVAVFETFNPLVATILGASFFDDESLTWNVIVGGVVILGGLGIVTFQQYREFKATGADGESQAAPAIPMDDMKESLVHYGEETDGAQETLTVGDTDLGAELQAQESDPDTIELLPQEDLPRTPSTPSKTPKKKEVIHLGYDEESGESSDEEIPTSPSIQLRDV